MNVICPTLGRYHDDVIKWKHFPRNWPFVREIHRSPVNFPHKGQWRGALMFSLIYAWINDWVNNREAGDLRRQHGHYDVIVMIIYKARSPKRLKTWNVDFRLLSRLHDDIIIWKKSAILILDGESPLENNGFSSQRTSKAIFYVFFYVRLNIRLNKQWCDLKHHYVHVTSLQLKIRRSAFNP